MPEAFASPPVEALDRVVSSGDVRVVGSPFSLGDVPARPMTAPPALDGDGDEVRAKRTWPSRLDS